jgi:hypothetical protein
MSEPFEAETRFNNIKLVQLLPQRKFIPFYYKEKLGNAV